MIAQAFTRTDDNTLAAKTAGQEETFVARQVTSNAVPQPQTTQVLQFFPTAEGFYDYKNSKYIYQYKDQVGNIRLSYVKNAITNQVEILDRNDYYPFGMNFVGNNSVFDAQGSGFNYKYGGKELQETGMYDFGARNYMPDVGRWFGVDPMAELAPDLSPYRYAFNNPISFTDPSGMYEDDGDYGEYGDDRDGPGRGEGPNDQWYNKGYDYFFERDSNNGGSDRDDFLEDMSQENNFSRDEEPINLFGPNEKSDAPAGVANSRPYRDNDGKFTVFGHGGPGAILDGNKYGIINNVEDFEKMMNDYSPNWNAAKDKKGTVLALWACSSATGDQNIVPFAAMISKAHPNITVIGVDGFLYPSKTVKGNYRIGSSDKIEWSGDGKGEVVSYRNGKEVYRSLFSDK